MSWPVLVIHSVVMVLAVSHALIHKRDHRAALGWIAIIIVFPVAGAVLYFLFGINRVRSAARRFTGNTQSDFDLGHRSAKNGHAESALPALLRIGERVTAEPTSSGNYIEMLVNGDAFFPRLIDAIDSASDTIELSTYLFYRRAVAGDVIDTLGRAVDRGVRVRVLIDSTGSLHNARRALSALRKVGVQLAEFRPRSLFPPSFGINLCNHRKIVVIDRKLAFFGGMNIDPSHMVKAPRTRSPREDVHFMVRGPMVARLYDIFRRDWWIATRESLEELGDSSSPGEGDVTCRVIDDGPDENLDALSMTLLGIFAAAQSEITIMTPYFLPHRELIAAMQSASLRGVRVRVIIPQRSNMRFVDWATRNMLWELLAWDVQIYEQAPPFSHTKLLTVDSDYVLAGSANIDPRSLRLNFELGVEMLDKTLATQVHNYLDYALKRCRRLTLEEVDARPLWQRLRDAFFWLFSSYL